MALKFIFQNCLYFLSLLNTVGFAQQAGLMLPIGHTDIIRSAVFSPDGKKVVTASEDKTAKIWEVSSGKLMANLRGHTDKVISAQFSPDGKKIVTSSWDSTAKIWDVVSGKILWNLKGHSKVIFSAQFSPDGKKIVTASGDKTAKLWEVETGRLLLSLSGENGHTKDLTYAQFSPACADDPTGGKNIVTASKDGSAKIWNAATGTFLHDLRHSSEVNSAQYSPDGKKIVTASFDKTAKLWNAGTGQLLFELAGHTNDVISVRFSPACPDDPTGGKLIVTASKDSSAKIWDAATGKWIADLVGHNVDFHAAEFSPDGKKIVTCSGGWWARIWDVGSAKLVKALKGHRHQIMSAHFSPDGKKILTASMDNTAKIWDAVDAVTWKPLINLVGRTAQVHSTQFSPDGKLLVTSSDDKTAKVWDALTGKLLFSLIGHTGFVVDAEFSPDGSRIVTASWDSTANIWDAVTGDLSDTLRGHKGRLTSAHFSPDGKQVVTSSYDGTAKTWDVGTGRKLDNFIGHTYAVQSARFSKDGKKIITASFDDTVKIWDAATGNFERNIGQHGKEVMSAQFNPDGKTILTASQYKTARLWDAVTGEKKADLVGHTDFLWSAEISWDGKMIATASNDGTAKIWDGATGLWIADLIGHRDAVSSVHFSKDGKKIATTSWDNTTKIWSLPSGKCLYTFFALDKNDFLVVDSNNHYDGSEGARKSLYFTCGTEIIMLDQVKDQLWVPYLAERINKKEPINAPSLDNLNVCDRTPIIENISKNESELVFTIKPRGGGLGETVLSINGTETKPYKPGELTKRGDLFELTIKKDSLSAFYKAGDTNRITLKSYDEKNVISSRGAEVSVTDNSNKNAGNLFAIMIGVSDYKGDSIDLNYAAKDARDISATLSNISKKYFRKGDNDHVFMYNLTSSKSGDQSAKKDTIKKVFSEIGKIATANDILLIFFAGHGIVKEEENKNVFYFLTADASSFNSTDKFKKEGISTSELIEWMDPSVLKAQKRILIIDACQSGQAISDLEDLAISKLAQNAQQVKAIDKLNEKAGMYILSASASNQSAYELGKYSQGLLTYSLLKVIKQDPSVLDDKKYLNMSLWFTKAGKIVKDLATEGGARQDPEFFSNPNFPIGEVDTEVIAKIVLVQEKPLFTASKFFNMGVSDDNLNFSDKIDDRMAFISSRGKDGRVEFLKDTKSNDAFSLRGSYEVSEKSISVSFIIKKNNVPIHDGLKEKISGSTDHLDELAEKISMRAAELAK